MTKPVLIIKNMSHEGPEILAEVLKGHGVPADICDLQKGDDFPDPTSYAALIVMGGGQSANDDTEQMKMELRQVRKAIESGIPFFGICLGLQVGVKAMGGKVIRNTVREIGHADPDGTPFTVNLTDAGKKDPLLAEVDNPLSMFHLHGETVELTPSMTALGTGTWCTNQLVMIANRAYGIQGHLELTEKGLNDWCIHDGWLKEMDPKPVKEGWRKYATDYRRNCERIFGNFLEIAQVG